MVHREPYLRKLSSVRSNAKRRGIPCDLTLVQFKRLLTRAGIELEDLGRTRGKYHLARKGDKGSYTIGNCRFITVEQNHAEKHQNGGTAAAGLKRRGKNGLTKENHVGTARQADKISRNFRAIDPTGKKYSGKNLTEFCKSHGLNFLLMSRVCRGQRFHHKGWAGEYV